MAAVCRCIAGEDFGVAPPTPSGSRCPATTGTGITRPRRVQLTTCASLRPDPVSAPADRLFFATRQAAEDHLYREEREPAEQATFETPPIKQLRRAMADAHPDRGGTAEQFIQAHRRYQTALRPARP